MPGARLVNFDVRREGFGSLAPLVLGQTHGHTVVKQRKAHALIVGPGQAVDLRQVERLAIEKRRRERGKHSGGFAPWLFLDARQHGAKGISQGRLNVVCLGHFRVFR